MPTIPKTGAKATTAEDMPEIINNVIDAMPTAEAAQLEKVRIVGEQNDLTGRVVTQEDSIASLRAIGTVLYNKPNVANAFYTTLTNLVAFIIITSRLYENPLGRWTKKGIIETGETIEDIFIGLASVFQFSPTNAEKNVFARVIQDPPVAFYRMNFQKFYKMTYSVYETRQAFLSFQGVNDLLSRKIQSMYTAMNYDEYLMTKYMSARAILNGYFYPVPIQQINGSTARDVTTSIVAAAQSLQFMSKKYNVAGVDTYSDITDQLILLTPSAYANFRVNVLALSFNKEDAQLTGNVVMFDGFSEWDTERLQMLFTDENGNQDPAYVPLTDDEITQLSDVEVMMVDKDFFQIYDNLLTSDDLKNPEGLYTNYWLHVWKTFAISPFSVAIVFSNGTPSVTSVTVNPSTLTMTAGQNASFVANVVTQNFATTAVDWSVSGGTDSTIDYRGWLSVGKSETAATLTVTATSRFDKTKSAVATVTISNNQPTIEE